MCTLIGISLQHEFGVELLNSELLFGIIGGVFYSEAENLKSLLCSRKNQTNTIVANGLRFPGDGTPKLHWTCPVFALPNITIEDPPMP